MTITLSYLIIYPTLFTLFRLPMIAVDRQNHLHPLKLSKNPPISTDAVVWAVASSRLRRHAMRWRRQTGGDAVHNSLLKHLCYRWLRRRPIVLFLPVRCSASSVFVACRCQQLFYRVRPAVRPHTAAVNTAIYWRLERVSPQVLDRTEQRWHN